MVETMTDTYSTRVEIAKYAPDDKGFYTVFSRKVLGVGTKELKEMTKRNFIDAYTYISEREDET